MNVFVFLFVLGSALIHALWNFAAKKASGNLHVIWFSLCLSTLFSFPLAWYVGMPQYVSAQTWTLVLVSGFVLGLYFFLLGKAYSWGDISTVYPVARGFGVLGTGILAILLLKEDVSTAGMAGIFAVTLGIVLVGIQKKKTLEDVRALHYALLVGCTIVAYSLMGKVVVQSLHPLTYGFLLQFLQMVFFGFVIFPTSWEKTLWPTLQKFWKETVVIGIGSPAVYLLILFAFQLAPASYVVAVRESSVAFGALLGFVVLREKCTLQKILGIGAIVVGMVFIQMA